MKSLLVIVLFALSLLALVAVLRSRAPRVAFVPVPAQRSLARGRARSSLRQPSAGPSTVDFASIGRELRFRQATSSLD